MFSKPSHGQFNSPQDVNLKSSPADLQVSARNRNRSLLVKIAQEPVGCRTFGQCFLARCRNIKAVVKEMKRRNSTFKESERRNLEVLHEANILYSLGDHAGLPFLLGVYTEQGSYCLVIQFHGCGEESLTLHKQFN